MFLNVIVLFVYFLGYGGLGAGGLGGGIGGGGQGAGTGYTPGGQWFYLPAFVVALVQLSDTSRIAAGA